MKNLLCLFALLLGLSAAGQPILRQILSTNAVANPPVDGFLLTTLNGFPTFEAPGQPAVIQTNFIAFTTNFYINNNIVSNYFITNVFTVSAISNYFQTFNSFITTNVTVTNTFITNYLTQSTTVVSNLTLQMISTNSYVSNYFQTNIFNSITQVITNSDLWWALNPLTGAITNVNGGGVSIGPGTNGASQVYLFDSSGTFVIGGFDTNAHAGFWGPGIIWTNDLSNGANYIINTAPIAVTNLDDNQNNAFNNLWNSLPTPGHQFYTMNYFRNLINNDSYYSNATEVLGNFTLLNATNIFQSGWPYGGGGVDSVSGECISSAISDSDYVAVYGFSQAKGRTQVGVGGFVDSLKSGQTNFGMFGSVTLDQQAANAGTYIGGYFELLGESPTNLPTASKSAVIVADNRDTGLPIQLWGQSNGTYVASMGPSGAFTASSLTVPSLFKSPTNAPAVSQLLQASSTAGDSKWADVNQIITNVVFDTIYATNIFVTNITSQTSTSVTNIFNVGKGGTLVITNGLTNLNLTASSVVTTDPNKALTTAANAHGVLTNSASGPPSFGLLQNTELVNSSITVNGTANQVNVSGSPVSLGGSVTLSTPQNINVGASPTFNGVNITNLTYQYTTNPITGLNLVYGQALFTNISANITVTLASPANNYFETSVLWVTNSGGTDFKVTFPSGVWGTPGSGTPPAYYCTNKMLTRIMVEHYGNLMTNAYSLSFAP